MNSIPRQWVCAGLAGLGILGGAAKAQESGLPGGGTGPAQLIIRQDGPRRTYQLRSDAPLRENLPAAHEVVFSEASDRPVVRTGNPLFDGLYALALHEARLNSVSEIQDWAYGQNTPLKIEAFQTGEKWTYVWTRDLAYSCDLAMACFDPARAVTSLLFKTSTTKDTVAGGYRNQIIQDTGSGGSYPVSSDRIVWALGADAALRWLPDGDRQKFLRQAYPILQDTIEQDRRLIFDPADGLYRGEQSFLDWREQTYPHRTAVNVLPIALSKALSVNVLYFHAIGRAAAYARWLGRPEEAARYTQWAAELKVAINRGFYDETAGLYSAYLYSEGGQTVRTHRYDLLGESLVILTGVASPEQAASILGHYPVGPHGPSVVWPQDRDVPIYHNQAIWPFVTSYWLKAARKAGHAEAVERGIAWMQKGAAENLSNMENFDFVTGRAEVRGQSREGPVVNSRRQLWSVAGYLAMVQDVVFGMETEWDGVRFRPLVTAALRRGIFARSDTLELRDLDYRGARIQVRVHLPALGADVGGICQVVRSTLNGREIGDRFVSRSEMQAVNVWDVYLEAPVGAAALASLRMVDVSNEAAIFGPAQPRWDESRGVCSLEQGQTVLHFLPGDGTPVRYNIYRDGQLQAAAWPDTSWKDAGAGDGRVHHYSVEAVNAEGGNASHPTPELRFPADRSERVIRADEFIVRGGKRPGGHLEEWGRTGDTVETPAFQVQHDGRHVIRAEFSNGAGPINTGITCAVKKLEVIRADNRQAVVTGYLVMPQSGDWQRWDLSSPVTAPLRAGVSYLLRLSEDEVSRNMSYLTHNARYTSWPGGGDQSYNYVRLASLRVLNLDK